MAKQRQQSLWSLAVHMMLAVIFRINRSMLQALVLDAMSKGLGRICLDTLKRYH